MSHPGSAKALLHLAFGVRNDRHLAPTMLVAVRSQPPQLTNSCAPKNLSITRLEQMPAFDNYDPANVKNVSAVVFDMLEVEDGLNAIVGPSKKPCHQA